jgi:hypothetical protein
MAALVGGDRTGGGGHGTWLGITTGMMWLIVTTVAPSARTEPGVPSRSQPKADPSEVTEVLRRGGTG